MAKDTKQLAGGFETENTGGLLTGFLADEDDFDRRSLWRLNPPAAKINPPFMPISRVTPSDTSATPLQ